MRAFPSVLFLPLLAPMLLAGCKSAPAPRTQPSGNVAQPPAPASPATPATKAAAVTIASRTGGLDFDFGWPAEAAAIAPLDTWLRGQAETARSKALAEAQNDQKSAKENNYPFHDHSFVQHWSTAADTPALLVLNAEGYTFTGGAHGMPFTSTILWDKAGQKRLATAALFDVPALAGALKPRFCKALNDQRAKKRGAPVDTSGKGPVPEFDQCVDMAKQELVPLSRGGKALDTVQIVIMPYEAGPYAEGTYKIDLPLDEAALKTVKPDWRGAFTTG